MVTEGGSQETGRGEWNRVSLKVNGTKMGIIPSELLHLLLWLPWLKVPRTTERQMSAITCLYWTVCKVLEVAIYIMCPKLCYLQKSNHLPKSNHGSKPPLDIWSLTDKYLSFLASHNSLNSQCKYLASLVFPCLGKYSFHQLMTWLSLFPQEQKDVCEFYCKTNCSNL